MKDQAPHVNSRRKEELQSYGVRRTIAMSYQSETSKNSFMFRQLNITVLLSSSFEISIPLTKLPAGNPATYRIKNENQQK